MEVIVQLHAPTTVPPRKQPRTHFIGGRVGPIAGLDDMKRGKSLAPTWNQTSFPRPSIP
jgi:hypothetical protein